MQIHGALLALHTERPVKIVYSREESFVGHVHRHPAKIWMEHRATPRRQARQRPGADPARRRRLRLVERGRLLERGRVRLRPVQGRERADRVDLRLLEQPALRRDARLRRRPGLLRARGADGQARRSARDRPGRAAPPERARPGRHAPDRPDGDGLAAGRRGDPPRRRAARCRRPRSCRATRSASRAAPGNTTRGQGVQRGVGFAVGFKNVCYSEGFDDACSARVRLWVGADEQLAAEVHCAAAEVGQGVTSVILQVARTELGTDERRRSRRARRTASTRPARRRRRGSPGWPPAPCGSPARTRSRSAARPARRSTSSAPTTTSAPSRSTRRPAR